MCVECWCCVQTTEELLFVQTRYGGSSTGQNNSPALHPAPLPSPQSRVRASCPALIFWTSLARILPARSAWRCHPTWISCPSGQRGSREAVVGYFSALSSGRHLPLFLCHASSMSSTNLVFNLPVYHSGIHTHTHTHIDYWQKIALDLRLPMGGRRNMFVRRHRGVMAANQRHLLLHGASIISTQHKPNWWKTGKKNLFFTPSTWSLLGFSIAVF